MVRRKCDGVQTEGVRARNGWCKPGRRQRAAGVLAQARWSCRAYAEQSGQAGVRQQHNCASEKLDAVHSGLQSFRCNRELPGMIDCGRRGGNAMVQVAE